MVWKKNCSSCVREWTASGCLHGNVWWNLNLWVNAQGLFGLLTFRFLLLWRDICVFPHVVRRGANSQHRFGTRTFYSLHVKRLIKWHKWSPKICTWSIHVVCLNLILVSRVNQDSCGSVVWRSWTGWFSESSLFSGRVWHFDHHKHIRGRWSAVMMTLSVLYTVERISDSWLPLMFQYEYALRHLYVLVNLCERGYAADRYSLLPLPWTASLTVVPVAIIHTVFVRVMKSCICFFCWHSSFSWVRSFIQFLNICKTWTNNEESILQHCGPRCEMWVLQFTFSQPWNRTSCWYSLAWISRLETFFRKVCESA